MALCPHRQNELLSWKSFHSPTRYLIYKSSFGRRVNKSSGFFRLGASSTTAAALAVVRPAKAGQGFCCSVPIYGHRRGGRVRFGILFRSPVQMRDVRCFARPHACRPPGRPLNGPRSCLPRLALGKGRKEASNRRTGCSFLLHDPSFVSRGKPPTPPLFLGGSGDSGVVPR